MFPYKISKNNDINLIIIKIIKHITSYTAGVYYLHEPIFNILRNFFDEKKLEL